ncbi:hypothetical protein BJ165DRAFT_1534077 [Panaeolus papilionaceus]|nr:hypothetical protein BJ165DRAFT_1534077 [Panaeolus papilionaceus]
MSTTANIEYKIINVSGPVFAEQVGGVPRDVLPSTVLVGKKLITTMWDNLGGEHAVNRAEETYKQLQKGIWEDFMSCGAGITRFLNTKESALSILDRAIKRGTGTNFSIEDHAGNIQKSPFHINLITDLQYRIQNLNAHLPTLQDELTHAEALDDQLLESILQLRLQEAEEDLARFQEELDHLGPLPSPLATPVPEALETICDVRNPSKFTRLMKSMKCWGKALGDTDVRATSSSAGNYTLDDRREVNVAEGALRLRIGVSGVY